MILPIPDMCRMESYDFDLPEDRIATNPVEPRDHARLLHVKKNAQKPLIEDRHVYDLPSILRPTDVLVLNNTKVIPARLYGLRGDVKVEILLHKRESAGIWRVLARPAKRLKKGDMIHFTPRAPDEKNASSVSPLAFSPHTLTAKVCDKGPTGDVVLDFEKSDAALLEALDSFGHIPLPPYIKREDGDTREDRTQYQTVYATREGAVAAPTAGLHFTPELLEKLKNKGIGFATVTLHVGAGTFLPVKAEDIRDHVMHAEWGEIAPETATFLNKAKEEGRRIIPVGTTALRILETASDDKGCLHAFSGDTSIFIYPSYRFKFIDALMTNFHLPKSTLFMLVSAFAGLETMKQAYAHAIAEKYRFYSYGDASLLETETP